MSYLVRRVAFYLVTAWAAITMNFFIPRMMPGNPVSIIISRMSQVGPVTPAMRNALAIQFGISNAPLWAQYGDYWNQLLHGQLGTSISNYPASVGQVIGQALPWTIGLIGSATVITAVVGTIIGALAAWRRGSVLDGVLPVSAFLQALPFFWVGLLAIQYIGVDLKWFPVGGGYAQGMRTAFSSDLVASASYHAILPALVIVLTGISGWIVGQRNLMITTLDQDYILVAQAKGISPRRVLWMYAVRNAILPQFASFAVALGQLVGGALIVELVFNYPGIGDVLLNAVSNDDYPTMQGIFLIITLVVLAANFIVDMLYVLVDPRARQEA
jgi:peptide/nickel transport system permease protein